MLEDTKENVAELLSSEKPKDYAMMDDGDGKYHYSELLTDSIQTINWLAKESLPYGKSKRLLASTYERYCLFLEELGLDSTHPETVNYLRMRAEVHLQHLCRRGIDEIEDQLEAYDCDKQELAADKAILDSMFQKSNERYSKAVKEAEAFNKYVEEAEREDAGPYHKKFGGFTKQLRMIMNENPSLPVVILSQTRLFDGELECSVAYIHDKKTGHFKEEIIAIYNSSDMISENNPDIYFDLPFC